jgi:type II secretory pathway predicted ATPase ExeA
MMSLKQPFEESYPVLFQKFNEFLFSEFQGGRHTIVIVDEAQNLGIEALEELRMLSNINADKDQFLQVVLVGQPQLKDMLRTPQLQQFAQRVSSDFHLLPLNPPEVEAYINHRLYAVGSRFKLFSTLACHAIAEASLGIPRTINILCDTALVYGFAVNSQQIGPDLVREVIQNKSKFGVLPLAISTGRASPSPVKSRL